MSVVGLLDLFLVYMIPALYEDGLDQTYLGPGGRALLAISVEEWDDVGDVDGIGGGRGSTSPVSPGQTCMSLKRLF